MAITQRKGLSSALVKSKLLPGECAVTTDTGELYFCYSAGNVKKVATEEDVQAMLDASSEAYAALQQLIVDLDGNPSEITNILNNITSLQSKIGDLSLLETEVKTNLVLAINENTSKIADIVKYVKVFNTTEDLLNSNEVNINSIYFTLGRNAVNDGGGCYFKCEAIGAHVDNGGTFRVSGSHAFIAITNGRVNAGIYGVLPNSADIRSAIQKCVDNEKAILIPPSTYNIVLPNINDCSGFIITEGVDIEAYGAVIKVASGTSLPNYQIVDIDCVDETVIRGLVVIGERGTHIGNTGEWGFCFRTRNGSKSKLIDCIGVDPWGDAFFVGESISYGVGYADCKLYNCGSIRSRRNGFSVVSAIGGAYKCWSEETNGVAPQRGICIEPDDSTNYMDFVVEGFTSKKNFNGALAVSILRVTDRPTQVTISGITSIEDGKDNLDSNHAILIETGEAPTTINISNVSFTKLKNLGVTKVNAGSKTNYILDNIQTIGARNSSSQVLHEFVSTAAGSRGIVNFTDIDCDGVALYTVYNTAGIMNIKANIVTDNAPTNKFIDGASGFYLANTVYNLVS